MSLEFKKITWKNTNARHHFYNSKHSYIHGMVSLSGSFCKLQHPIYFAIENFITKHNKLYFNPNVFYLYIDNKKIRNTFISIDQAKEFAQKSLEEFIIKMLFETPPKRKVIVEKCKFKESRLTNKWKYTKAEFITKAEEEVFDLKNCSKQDMLKWNKIKYNYQTMLNIITKTK